MSFELRIGAAAALVIALSTGAALAQLNIRQAPGPTPGQCKAAPVVAMGHNAVQAQLAWVGQTAQAHGNNWSLWIAAADRAIVPNGAAWMAMGRPCYVPPVP